MVADATTSSADSDLTWRSLSRELISRNAIIGLILCLLACVLAVLGFWRLGGSSGYVLKVTDYITDVPAGQFRTFGFGGTSQTAMPQSTPFTNVGVPFQSRAMSSLSFSISHEEDGTYWIKGEEDDIQIRGEQFEKGNKIRLTNGASFKAVGQFGSASFTAELNEEPNKVRLHLRSPFYYRLTSDETRVTFGAVNEVVSAPISEVVVRTSLRDSQGERFILKKKEDGGFSIIREDDLARSASVGSEVLTAIGGTQASRDGAASINAGDSHRIGTAMIRFASDVGWGPFSATPSRYFGVKLIFIMLLLACVFGLQGLSLDETQVRIPYGSIIFACVTVFSVIGLVLTARDYFLPPFEQGHYTEYVKALFYSLVALYLIRIPLGSFYEWLLSGRSAFAFLIFLIVFFLLGKPSIGLIRFPFIEFITFFFGGAFVTNWVMRAVRTSTEYLSGANWLPVLILVVLVPIFLIMLVAYFTGGHSALTFHGVRFHIPTILTPLVTFGTALTVTLTERGQPKGWKKHRFLALFAILCAIGGYYYFSGFDHGGSFLLGVGGVAAMWFGSRVQWRDRPWVIIVALVALMALALYLAVVMEQQRIVIAWGGEEGAERFFSESVNLRTARDMAHAGGLRGLYEQLFVPSSVGMNIHNDLVTAYIAGFFGLLGLALVAWCYYLFYTRLLDGVLSLTSAEIEEKKVVPTARQRTSAWEPMPTLSVSHQETAQSNEDRTEEDKTSARHVFVAYALSITLIFLVQFIWVFTATLWRRFPISGLDLQPISASILSVVAFFIILLGSITFVRNVVQDKGVAEST